MLCLLAVWTRAPLDEAKRVPGRAQPQPRGGQRQSPCERLAGGQPRGFLALRQGRAGIDGFALVRRSADIVQKLAPGLEAAIDQAPGAQPLQGVRVVGQVVGLPADRPFPLQAQPGQVVEDRRLELGSRPRRVDILDAQYQPAIGLPRQRLSAQGRKSVAAVQPAGGGGGEAGDQFRLLNTFDVRSRLVGLAPAQHAEMFQHPAQEGFLAAEFRFQRAELNEAAHFRQPVSGAPGCDGR